MLDDDLLDLGPPGIDSQMGEAELAELLGVATSTIRRMARDGIAVRCGRGKFDVKATLSKYLTRLRDTKAVAGRPSNGGDELKAERTRLARQQADKLELANAAARRELLPASDVEREWAGVLRTVRAELLALPPRLSARLGHLTPHDLSEIDLELRAVLGELADA